MSWGHMGQIAIKTEDERPQVCLERFLSIRLNIRLMFNSENINPTTNVVLCNTSFGFDVWLSHYM
jgi:hypothetical protein